MYFPHPSYLDSKLHLFDMKFEAHDKHGESMWSNSRINKILI